MWTLWSATQLDAGAAQSGVRRGLSALSSFTDTVRYGSPDRSVRQ